MGTGDHDKVLSCLNDIVVEVNVLIAGVRGGAILDVELEVFAGSVYGLIDVRHCFFLFVYFSLYFFYSMLSTR